MAFIVAHRAGNDLERLRRAEVVRPRLIEADVDLLRRVTAALDGREITVCGRRWSALEPFAGRPEVRVVHSVGLRRRLRALRRRFPGRRLSGISIHRRLLDDATVADLRERADLIVSWPGATLEEAGELWRWGIDGVITEHFEALA